MATVNTKKGVTLEERPVYEKMFSLTGRVKKLKEAYLAAASRLCSERSHLLTEYWKQSEGEQIDVRRAKAYKYILERLPIVIRDGELIVGGQTKEIRGCSAYPEHSVSWIIKELDEFPKREVRPVEVSEEDRQIIWEDCQYWIGKSVQDKALVLWREQWGSRLEDAEEARVIFGGLSSPIPAGARCVVDYAKVINKGLNGVIEEAKAEIERLGVIKTADDVQKKSFLQSVIIACEGVINFAGRYAHLTRELAGDETRPDRKSELEKIAEICEGCQQIRQGHSGRLVSPSGLRTWVCRLTCA